ncbi:conjugal transfer protein TraN [Citrobacter freundii]|uniref:conjugal transfer protein TraN n=1 Tax=Citrobacter freundii TaxID=546 RepID=UPI000FD75B03|nr:conjugal transfer protein TraN [Citrobacter freundii]RVS10412.1 conjugal transfer protein [Citrobacter freundii]
MFRRLISCLLIFCYVVTFLTVRPAIAAVNTPAQNYSCGIDKNGDGSFDSEGEYAACINVSDTQSQPANVSCASGYTHSGGQCVKTDTTDVTYSCPNQYYLQNGMCEKTVSIPASYNDDYNCKSAGHPYPFYVFAHLTQNGLFCAATNEIAVRLASNSGCELYGRPNAAQCAAAFDPLFANGQVVKYSAYYCPAGMKLNGTTCEQKDIIGVSTHCPANAIQQGNKCLIESKIDEIVTCPSGWTLSNKICTTTTSKLTCPLGNAPCIDLNLNKPVDEGNIDGSMLVDDGKKTDEGVCLDQLLIFSGRAQDCKLAGVDTAFKNCCKSEGKVFTDSVGALGSISEITSTVSKLYTASKEAYLYYEVAMQATGDAAVASQMAAQGFSQSMALMFNPATIAISVAIYFAMEYLMKACDQTSMETAMAAGSGYCHEVGKYCKKKIPLLGCVQKATSYCCFNSKLARIIHEQGRPQLKNFDGWGKAGSPQCRGFTPDEFQALDFSKIDMTEYVEDMVKKATDEIQADVNQTIKDFYDKTN